MDLLHTVGFPVSYVLQGLGFIGIVLAWVRALQELIKGTDVPRTRKLLFLVATVAMVAYIVPAVLTVCYFVEGCMAQVFRDYLRVSNGVILFLFGLFMFLLYFTKEEKHE